jgi:ATP-dependent RNA helicase DDX52/ROK1
MCVAPTGSGKTLAYVLPTLVKLQDPARSLGEEGRGIRALFVVPTHDLAIQIEGVAKAVTRRRGWRVMVLTKATQKAVIDSAPGSAEALAEGEDEDAEAEAEDDEEEDEDDDEAESGDEKKKGGKKDKSSLGIDILISTPERLHHLLQENQLSLSSYVLFPLSYPSQFIHLHIDHILDSVRTG